MAWLRLAREREHKERVRKELRWIDIPQLLEEEDPAKMLENAVRVG